VGKDYVPYFSHRPIILLVRRDLVTLNEHAAALMWCLFRILEPHIVGYGDVEFVSVSSWGNCNLKPMVSKSRIRSTNPTTPKSLSGVLKLRPEVD